MSMGSWFLLMVLMILITTLGLLHGKKNDFEPMMPLIKAHQFLSHKKVPLRRATPHELSLVEGISFKMALKIAGFIAGHKSIRLADLDEVKGIGPKMIEKLAVFFCDDLETSESCE